MSVEHENSTLEDLIKKGDEELPAVVLSRSQAQLVFRRRSNLFDTSGVPVAKPWQTQYRGEVFLYIPRKAINVPIYLPDYGFDERPVKGGGIEGILNLRSILCVSTESKWREMFPIHKEEGHLPYEPSFLWFLDPIVHYLNPTKIRVGGKWVGEEELPGYTVPTDLEHYILPPKRRVLHTISLHKLLYESYR